MSSSPKGYVQEGAVTASGKPSMASYMRDYRKRLKEKGLKPNRAPIPKEASKVKKAATITLTVKYIPHDKQKLFAKALDDGKRIVLYVGGIRAGKTYAGARETLRNIYQRGYNKKGLGWIVSPTYPMSSIVEREFENACELDGGRSLIIKRFVGQRAYLLYPPPGCTKPYRVEIKTAEHPDRLRGSSLDWVWADETAMMDHDVYKILLGRILDTRGVMLLTTTPRGMNWLYEEICKKQETDTRIAVVRAMTSENPHLDVLDVENLRSQYSANFAKQELNAEFVSLDGLVYTNFDFNRHVVKPITKIPDGAEVIAGIDAGYKDPFVCLWLMKYKDRFYVVDEYYATLRTMENHSLNVKGSWLHSATLRRWMDPSAAQESADLNALQVHTFPAKNDIRAGINSVARLVETDRLFVASNCLNTLNEISMYRYKDSTSKNAGETPVDKDNHCMDALRYAIYSEDGYRVNHPYIIQHDNGTLQLAGLPKPESIDQWIAVRNAYPVDTIGGYEDGGDTDAAY